MAPCLKCGGIMVWDDYREERFCLICGFRIYPTRPVPKPAIVISADEKRAFKKGEGALGRYLKEQAAR